jgi:hypothetical protein
MELAKRNESELLPTNGSNTKTNQLAQAINGRKLRNFGGFQELERVFFMIWQMIGLKEDNYPGPEEASYLMNIVQKNYSQYTLEEIHLAFELAITRESLPFMGKGATVEHYQSFDFQYFSKIMFGFRRYKEHQLKPILAKQNKLKEAEPISDYDFLKLNFVNKFSIYVKGGYPWSYGIDLTIFEILVRLKKVELPKEVKVKAGQDVKRAMNLTGEIDEKTKNEWIKKTKIKCFQIFINDLRVNKIDLNELIKGI